MDRKTTLSGQTIANCDRRSVNKSGAQECFQEIAVACAPLWHSSFKRGDKLLIVTTNKKCWSDNSEQVGSSCGIRRTKA